MDCENIRLDSGFSASTSWPFCGDEDCVSESVPFAVGEKTILSCVPCSNMELQSCKDESTGDGSAHPKTAVESEAEKNTLDAAQALWVAYEQSHSSRDMLAAPDTYRPLLEAIPFSQNGLSTEDRRPFWKWAQKLHQRRLRQKTSQKNAAGRLSCSCPGDGQLDGSSAYRRQSSSVSSFAFVSAAREASMSVASTSIIGRSRRRTLRSSRGYSRAERSSRASTFTRQSEDYHASEKHVLADPVLLERSLHRRRILEELIKTEEGYIGDVRFLMNTYVTILASLPASQAGLRSSINRNLTEIVELHEEILGELHRVVPRSEYTQPELKNVTPLPNDRFRHRRWKSLDAVPENTSRVHWLEQIPGMTADPQDVAEVAKVFTKIMHRFFIYEEYGAKYELMFRDIDVAHKAIQDWGSYQKGLETLASCVGSTRQARDSKKALAIGDLLAKPIQRVCRYPLLFSELLKYTPVCDDPSAYMEIESTLARLREVTGAMNQAADDIQVKATLEKTWMLQDRLVFPDQSPNAVVRNWVRSLGHIQLCGVLHICWQTKDSVKGSYLICLLYRKWLCLASAERADKLYKIKACLPLDNCSLEEADNGRGLQCHTAPFSWKVVFVCDYQLYELLMTACTPKEELEWKRRLEDRVTSFGLTQPGTSDSSFLALDIKSLGTVFGKPGTVARRMSIHRATTLGPKSPSCQVILKNTCVKKGIRTTPDNGGAVGRSQSLQTTSRIPILTPTRADRARLEALVSDVWTREVLPFPGLASRVKNEHMMRSSATSVIRKLSVASLASTLGRHSLGRSSMHKKNMTAEIGNASKAAALSTESSFDAGASSAPKERDARQGDNKENAENKTPASKLARKSRASLVTTSTASLRKAAARLFEEDSRSQLNDKEIVKVGNVDHKRGCSSTGTIPKASATPVFQSDWHNPRGSSSSVDADTGEKLALYGSVYEAMYPLTRQPCRASAKSHKWWSRIHIFPRGTFSRSLGHEGSF